MKPLVKRCRVCKAERAISDFGPRRATCNACRAAASRAYYRQNRDRVLQRQQLNRPPYSSDRWLLQTYGITRADYDRLIEDQGGLCALGHDAPEGLVVDHDHGSGVVRGLLCERCNCGIGHLRDDPEICRRAAAYLERHGAPGAAWR